MYDEPSVVAGFGDSIVVTPDGSDLVVTALLQVSDPQNIKFSIQTGTNVSVEITDISIREVVEANAIARIDPTVVLDGGGATWCASISRGSLGGVVVTNGSAANGGGVKMQGGLVSNCKISGNHAEESGGGCSISGGKLQGCLVTENTCGENGGSYAMGGGIQMSFGQVEGCVVSRNALASESQGGSVFYGGGVCASGGSVAETLIVENFASNQQGGGICLFAPEAQAPTPVVRHCTISSNVAGACGGLRIVSEAGPVGIVTDTIVYDNFSDGPSAQANVHGVAEGFSYCDTNPVQAGEGNICADPLFAEGGGEPSSSSSSNTSAPDTSVSSQNSSPPP